jgi:hypothetical protein
MNVHHQPRLAKDWLATACLALAATACSLQVPVAWGQENDGDTSAAEVERHFSGPQSGEVLPEESFLFIVPIDDMPAERVEIAKIAKDKPIAILFMHEKSRPAFQTARALSSFAALRKDSGLQLFVVVLSDDRSASEQWLRLIRRYFEPSTHLAVADGGIEGPGPLGLNRRVDMTVLVAKDGMVTANFAITQVTAAVDAPAMLKAMSEISGGGDIPDVQELLPPSAPVQRVEQRVEQPRLP